jgi:hypothetical protein
MLNSNMLIASCSTQSAAGAAGTVAVADYHASGYSTPVADVARGGTDDVGNVSWTVTAAGVATVSCLYPRAPADEAVSGALSRAGWPFYLAILLV